MKTRAVVFSPEARDDLIALYDWIAEVAGAQTAIRYLERLEKHCMGFAQVSERGHSRGDIRPNLRITGFERRITIAFSIDAESVTILRLFYGGRDWEADLLSELRINHDHSGNAGKTDRALYR